MNEELVHQFGQLVKELDEDELAGFLIALVAGFASTMTESDAEALHLLAQMHMEATELVMDDGSGEFIN